MYHSGRDKGNFTSILVANISNLNGGNVFSKFACPNQVFLQDVLPVLQDLQKWHWIIVIARYNFLIFKYKIYWHDICILIL